MRAKYQFFFRSDQNKIPKIQLECNFLKRVRVLQTIIFSIACNGIVWTLNKVHSTMQKLNSLKQWIFNRSNDNTGYWAKTITHIPWKTIFLRFLTEMEFLSVSGKSVVCLKLRFPIDFLNWIYYLLQPLKLLNWKVHLYRRYQFSCKCNKPEVEDNWKMKSAASSVSIWIKNNTCSLIASIARISFNFLSYSDKCWEQ